MSETLYFSVDSALLRELGERLVGRHHIALAELVKNAYDADATRCEIEIGDNSITVRDNGHGMDRRDFERYWLRIGTTHKERENTSKSGRRGVTGSKGIGRLAVQFLAGDLVVRTGTGRSGTLTARVNWKQAVAAGELTQAPVRVDETDEKGAFAGGARHGFEVTLTKLRHEWAPRDFKLLAQEVWTLRPPFGSSDPKDRFSILLRSPDESSVDEFTQQLQKVKDTWGARIQLELTNGLKKPTATVRVSIRQNFLREDRRGINKSDRTFRWTIRKLPIRSQDDDDVSSENLLNEVQADIRIYRLQGVQRGGIELKDLGDYLGKFGGVMIYDQGFRLPYYGGQQDWLNLDRDSARRLSSSKLLPKALQIAEMMQGLPTQRHMLGSVEISTNGEAAAFRKLGRASSEHLLINPGRDRLIDNEANTQLRNLVRASIDYYISCLAKVQFTSREEARPEESSSQKEAHVATALQKYRKSIPDHAYNEISREFRDYSATVKAERSYETGVASLLGPLATAGMSALALDHEIARLVPQLREIAQQLKGARTNEFALRLVKLYNRLEASRRSFAHLIRREDREDKVPLLAKGVAEDVLSAVEPFLYRATVSVEGIGDYFWLPAASLATWSAMIQNLIFNALNATLDCPKRYVALDSGKLGRKCFLRVSDTGVGLDISIKKANDTLFEPFARRLRISDERRSLGLGGYGLGLTIVRMMAAECGCDVAFTEPRKGFSTSISLTWNPS